MNATEIKESYDDVLKYLENCIDVLDPVNKDMIHRKTDTKYMEYDSRTGEFVIATSIFDDMYWDQQYYNSIMRSSMNKHFKNILKEKGYLVKTNEDLGNHKINSKNLQEIVKDNNNETIERVLNDVDDSLTAGEKKVKKSMETRADILHVTINNEKFRDEITNDVKFMTHLNVCSLLNIDHDQKFIDKNYQELKVHGTTSNVTKVKLINEVQDLMDISPLCINDINNDVIIPEDKQEIIKKVFRLKNVSLVGMYRNLIPGLITSKNVKINGVRTLVYDIDSEVVNHHLALLQIRNKTLYNIDQTSINYFDYVLPKTKKLF